VVVEVPRGKWVSINVLRSVREKLEAIGREKGYNSLNDVIAYLITVYEEKASTRGPKA
jgi:hypothetical protein